MFLFAAQGCSQQVALLPPKFWVPPTPLGAPYPWPIWASCHLPQPWPDKHCGANENCSIHTALSARSQPVWAYTEQSRQISAQVQIAPGQAGGQCNGAISIHTTHTPAGSGPFWASTDLLCMGSDWPWLGREHGVDVKKRSYNTTLSQICAPEACILFQQFDLQTLFWWSLT